MTHTAVTVLHCAAFGYNMKMTRYHMRIGICGRYIERGCYAEQCHWRKAEAGTGRRANYTHLVNRPFLRSFRSIAPSLGILKDRCIAR